MKWPGTLLYEEPRTERCQPLTKRLNKLYRIWKQKSVFFFTLVNFHLYVTFKSKSLIVQKHKPITVISIYNLYTHLMITTNNTWLWIVQVFANDQAFWWSKKGKSLNLVHSPLRDLWIILSITESAKAQSVFLHK